MPTPIAEAQIAALFAQSVSYGLYFITFAITAHYLLRTVGPKTRWRNPDEIRWFFLSIAIALFINATFNLSLTFARVLDAFVHYNGDPAEYFGQVSSWINVTKTASLLFQALIGDVVWIYRSYVVYFRNWKIALPSLVLWLGGIVCACKATQVQATTVTTGTVNDPNISLYIKIFWGLTVAQSVFTTVLLIRRLWRIEKSNREYVTNLPGDRTYTLTRLQRVMLSIIESGMLHTVTAITALACQASNSNGIYVMGGLEVNVVGIAFNLTIIRATNEAVHESREQRRTDSGSYALRLSNARHHTTSSMGPVQVVITQEVERDGSESEDPQKRSHSTFTVV